MRGTFYFSHSEAILPFLSLLGLYQDNFTLTHAIFGEDKATQREYRTSFMGSFAQNVGFVFFECKNSNNNITQNKILTLHQEKIVKLGKCRHEECDWDEFKEAYEVQISHVYSYLFRR